MCVEPLKMRDIFTENLKSRAHIFFSNYENQQQTTRLDKQLWLYTLKINVKTVKKTKKTIFSF